MEYENPTIEVVGSPSDLIQNYVGPRYDGDGEFFSQMAICNGIEEE